jgi:hypothetical protein
MTRTELVRLARDLYTTHGLMPVPVAGKVPLGGMGWNQLPIDARLAIAASESCTGIGMQMGLIFHPVLGPKEARTIDCDIDDRQKSMLFAGTLNNYFHPTHWRWGRRPATLVFTDPGVIKREKFGDVQLLGSGKQVVYWGDYLNKLPLLTDPREYWMEGTSIFDLMPPVVPAGVLQSALEAGVTAAGYTTQSRQIEAAPLSADDLAMLNGDILNQFRSDMQSMLDDIDRSPTGSGRGTKLHRLGIKYGALIKASGNAPALVDAARISPDFVDYAPISNPVLAEIGQMAEDAFALLPGSLGQGDRRDFARGVGASMGLAQGVEVRKAKTPLLLPTGRDHPGQTVHDLMLENLPPLKFLVDRYLTDSGCVILAGKPKIGKGWIVLELGMCIAEGSQFWDRQCTQGEVLMYMLEDNKRRVRERIRILRPAGFNPSSKMRFRYSADGPFFIDSDGTGTLLDDMRKHMTDFPAIRFIVVDVLQRVRGKVERSDNAYQIDYKVIGALQKFAAGFSVMILVVHHVKKGRVDDAIDSVNGSFGVAGAADGAIIIGREGGIVRIESRMRDIPDFEFDLIKENGSPMWKPAQTVEELLGPTEGTKTQAVMLALHAAACCLTAGDLGVRTGISEKNAATYLVRLMKTNQVSRPSRGWYMAVGLPYRERIKGVIDVLKRMPKTVATADIKAKYGPNVAPLEATYMILTPVAIKEIEAGFVDGKDCLNSLKFRGLAVFNSDTTWLIGDDWEPAQPVMKENPFAQQRMPWQ